LKVGSSQLSSLLVLMSVSACAFAQYTRSTRSANVPVGGGPETAAPASGPLDRTNADPGTGTTRDSLEQSVWRAAQRLGLSSDQRTDLASALKAEKAERAAFDKALQDARHALADALANGQTYLDAEIENLTSATAKVQESDLKLWAKLYAVLDTDQQRRLLSMATPLSLATASHELGQGQ
jgi:hypothetical protein